MAKQPNTQINTRHSSRDDLAQAIHTDLAKRFGFQLSNPNSSSTYKTRKAIQIDDFVESFLKNTDPTFEQLNGSSHYVLRFYDGNSKVHTQSEHFVANIVELVTSLSGNVIFKCEDSTKFATQVIAKCYNKFDPTNFTTYFRPHRSHPHWIVVCKNGIYDRKKQKLITFDKAHQLYDFTTFRQLEFLQYKDLNKNQKKQYQSDLKFINERRQEWADDNTQHKLIQDQVAIAVIEGYGRQRVWLSKSPGGSGKTFFASGLMKMTPKNEHAVVIANLDQFKDDNAINDIHLDTHLVYGDDLTTRSVLDDLSIARIKSLTGNGLLKVNRKFKSSIVIATNAVILQNLNTSPNFFEQTKAMLDRFMILPWTQRNFRQRHLKNPEEFDELLLVTSTKLERFLEDDFSMSVWFTDLLKQPYFDDFDVPSETIDDMTNMLKANDVISHSMHEIMSKYEGFDKIPVLACYKEYLIMLKEENPGARPMKRNNFEDALKSSDDLNLEVTNRLVREKIRCLSMFESDYDLRHTTKHACVKLHNSLTKEELDELKQKVLLSKIDATSSLSIKQLNGIKILQDSDKTNGHVYQQILQANE